MKTAPMIHGNLALALEDDHAPRFTVIEGGRCANISSVTRRSTAATYVIIAILALAMIGFAVASVAGRSASLAHTLAELPRTSVTVKNGDSLWSIAADCDIPHLSTQEISDAIVSWNHLDSTTLVPGQVLSVPSK